MAFNPRDDLDRWQRLGPLLDQALQLDAEQRTQWLTELRGREPELSVDLEQLLRDHQRVLEEGFLEGSIVDEASPLLAGQVLGAYKLVEPIGQGGMGTVWLAERADGRFEGRAAVKLLNLSLIASRGSGTARPARAEERFKREGSLLARLTHPNIARLFDAGVSPGGQPFLVLEFIQGQPIDRYCDDRSLGVEDRIRLFLDVLAAVAHAHANLVVHRDLKPSNVLVSVDGQVKLLDFGIAKLLQEEEGTFATREGAPAALTPEYAAPEQVTGQRVTTATDVYSLGVLLYLLLGGQHPAGDAFGSPADLVKAIVDTEPSRLSDAVVSLVTNGRGALPAADAAFELNRNATRRGTTPDRLRRLLYGDLDTIVAKTLKKHADERYPSVTALADDLRRCLDHQPIAARPDTLAYRSAKFMRRHVVGVSMAVGVTLLVAALVGFYTIRLAAERDRARLEATKSEKVSGLMVDLLAGADPFRDRPNPTVRDLLEAGEARIQRELATEPALLADMLTVIGRLHRRLGDFDKAQALLEQALASDRAANLPERPSVAETLNVLGVLFRMRGDEARAIMLLEQAAAIRRRLLGPLHKDLAVTVSELGRAYDDAGRPERAEALSREALEMRLALFGDEHRETATNKGDLGTRLRIKGDFAGAEPLLRQSLATTRRVLGEGHANTAGGMSNLGRLMADKGNAGEAESLFRGAIAIGEQALGVNHPTLAGYFHNLGRALRDQSRYDESVAAIERAIALAVPVFGADSPEVADHRAALGHTHIARGDAASAAPLLRQALIARLRAHGPDDWRVGITQSLLGWALTALGRYDDAEAALLEATRILRDGPGLEGREAKAARDRLRALHNARSH